MLKTPTPYVKVFRFTTGEEIITKVLEDNSDNYLIESPFQLVNGPNGPQFAPLMVMVDPRGKMNIYKNSIMAYTNPTEEVLSTYESVTSGIALPQKSKIVV